MKVRNDLNVKNVGKHSIISHPSLCIRKFTWGNADECNVESPFIRNYQQASDNSHTGDILKNVMIEDNVFGEGHLSKHYIYIENSVWHELAVFFGTQSLLCSLSDHETGLQKNVHIYDGHCFYQAHRNAVSFFFFSLSLHELWAWSECDLQDGLDIHCQRVTNLREIKLIGESSEALIFMPKYS